MDDLELMGEVAKGKEKSSDTVDGSSAVDLPVVGDYIGKFRIEAILGHGGIGVVYRAYDPATEVRRAIKIPYPKNTQRDIDRFRVEAKICANLDHPNIIKFYNVDLYRGVLPYAEMDFVDGGSVLEHIREKPMPSPVALGVIVLICRALEYAHAKSFNMDGKRYEKLVHRDIKPGNILISTAGEVKLTDFGLAKFEGIDLHTITGALPGTVPYMAPEQHQSPVASVRTDIYSLGVTLYEMITGRRPFPEKGEDAFAQHIAAKIEGKYEPPSKIVPALHPDIDVMVGKCLDPDVRKRYSSYASIRMAAESVLGDYSELDAEDLVRLYFANRKNYRLAVADRPRRRIRLTANIKLLSVTFIIAAVASVAFIVFKKLDEIRDVLTGTPQVTAQTDRKTSPPDHAFSSTVENAARNGGGELNRVSALKTPGQKTGKDAVMESKKRSVERLTTEKQQTNKERRSVLDEGVASWRSGRYMEAVKVLTAISADSLLAVERDSVALIVLDSYYRTGKVNEALSYGSENMVNDAKYHILMALLFESAGMRKEAEASFAKSLSSPCRFDPSMAGKRYLYRAQYYRRAFESGRSQKDREAMIGALRDFLRYGCDKPGVECEDARRIVGETADK